MKISTTAQHYSSTCVNDLSIKDNRALMTSIEEPEFCVAAAERGKRVLVRAGTTSWCPYFTVQEYLLVDIPNQIHESWYGGQVSRILYLKLLLLSDMPLSFQLLSKKLVLMNLLCFCTVTGVHTYHRITYLSVQASLIALLTCTFSV